MVNEDWSSPQNVKAIKQGVRTYNILAWSLNKNNYAGMFIKKKKNEKCKFKFLIIGFVLDEVMNKLQDFCWISNAKEQVNMLSKYCDKFFEINASHCSKVS